MTMSICFFHLALLFLVVFAKGDTTLSIEDIELEHQLNILNKPPIKSVRDEAGGLFDCIDIYKQPAFDHPLLKSHKIQMKPTFVPGSMIKDTPIMRKSRIDLKGVECPRGTVPIKRTRKEDLIRARSFANYSSSIHPLVFVPLQSASNKRALFSTEFPVEVISTGAQTEMNVIKPAVGENQSVFSKIWVNSATLAEGDKFASLQAGWTVSPKINGDHETRFFVRWEAQSQGKVHGCFNNHCLGFVHVNHAIPLNLLLRKTSVYEGPEVKIHVSIHKDPKTGNWWLTFEKNIQLGYWPKDLVPQLSGGADHLGWGGSVWASPDGIYPPMGFGNFPDKNYQHSSGFHHVEVLDKEYNPQLPFGLTGTVVDHPKCYSLKNTGYVKVSDGYKFFYGGPGGQC